MPGLSLPPPQTVLRPPMYAVIATGGKQYRVTKDGVLRVEKLDAEPGSTVEFGEVLLVGQGAEVKLGKPLLKGGKVDFLEVRTWLDELSTLVESRNVHGLVKTLTSLVPEYRPSEEIMALCDVDRHDSISRFRRGRATLGAHVIDAAA